MSNPTYYVHYYLPEDTPIDYGYSHHSQALQRAAFCVFNQKGSGQVVRVKKLQVNQSYGLTSTTSNRNAAALQRISAYTGGRTVTPVAADSAATALPAQVTCVQEPTSVTATTTLLSFHTIPQYTQFVSGAPITTKFPGDRQKNFDLGTLVRPGYGNSSVQSHILREGEGLAIVQTGQKITADYHVQITFTDGTNTWIVKTFASPWYTNPWVALLNGVGSGKVLYVYEVSLIEAGDTSEPVFDATLVDDIDVASLNGGALTLIKADSAAANPSSYILAYRDVLVTEIGGRLLGAPVPYNGCNWSYRRPMFCMPGCCAAGLTNTNLGNATDYQGLLNGSELIVQEGYGVAFMRRRPGMGGRKEFLLEFTTEAGTSTPRAFPIFGGMHLFGSSRHGR